MDKKCSIRGKSRCQAAALSVPPNDSIFTTEITYFPSAKYMVPWEQAKTVLFEEKTHMRTAIAVLAMMMLVPAAPFATKAQKNAHTVPQKGTQRYENWLHQEVRHRLLLLPWYTVFDQLGYRVNGYTVTLTGNVVKPSLKSEAENTVKRIEGVEKVVNEIHVLPNSPMDNQLRIAEYRKIYSQPSLFKYGVGNLQSIHILVENGHVTLVGFVDSQTDKNLAGIQANSVPNVFSVKNDLVVRNNPK